MPQETSVSPLTTVTDNTFAELVLASDRPVVVDFWAEWCPPCKMIEKSLVELAREFGDRMVIAKLNSDDNPQATRRYGVMSLPTLLVFRRGEVVGSRPKLHLRQSLTMHAGL
ncbi:thioredoxin domain-containing protein [Micromonospora vinacea]|uniref:thioredoxin family protein n=1 Tax=Micromonospora vinacea TaxID=709878 RepID=UPI00344FA8DB